MKQSKITLQRFPIPEPLLLLLFSCVLVTLFSTCSPLYPINPWDDADVFMTVGKSMLRGKVLYRDIFDQKGPVLFFLHELAAAISYTSFLGIYIFEVLGLWCFAWYSLKSIRLFSDSRLNMPLLCLLMLLTVTSDAFFYGDSAEEFCLPLLSHALYFMLRFVKERETQPSPVQGLLFGAGMGIVFWIKFNIVVFFYGGSLLALICIACHERRLRELARVVPWALLGMAAVTVAVLAYFIRHHAIDALVDAYFYTNLFKYTGISSNGEPDVWWFIFVKLAIMTVLLLPVLLAKARNDVKLLVLGGYGALLLSFTFLTVQFYYFLLLFVYGPLFIVFFRRMRPKARVYGFMLGTSSRF